MTDTAYSPRVFGAYNKDDHARLLSSSGGIFHALAKAVIEQNGVVYGAVLEAENESYNCHHQRCDRIIELYSLLGSKYIQSALRNIFANVKRDLLENRKVLFCGTPCQVAGLAHFLGKRYENLILVDFVCHGVPSKFLLDKVISEEGTEMPVKVEFRNKKFGWQNYAFKLSYRDGRNVYRTRYESDFMKLYLTNAYMRPSCYRCPFKGKNLSDVTLGDFWGAERFDAYHKEDLEMGISLVVANTLKGQQILIELGEAIVLREIDMTYFDNANFSYRQTPDKPLDRNKLNVMLNSATAKEILTYYRSFDFARELIRKIRRKVRRNLKHNHQPVMREEPK